MEINTILHGEFGHDGAFERLTLCVDRGWSRSSALGLYNKASLDLLDSNITLRVASFHFTSISLQASINDCSYKLQRRTMNTTLLSPPSPSSNDSALFLLGFPSETLAEDSLNWNSTPKEKNPLAPGTFGWPIIGETIQFLKRTNQLLTEDNRDVAQFQKIQA
ncbi:hypothetical protein RND71_009780 [Anisodus tanguticus]|uniref:Uncharacterized protein n=1 Tax=Anisodus tanguticus TaxID=243964 RepID=A0AAE1SHY6_9SOLA|nr:hypothetical protein RND71_009780 [Anisodus tanguticus]